MTLARFASFPFLLALLLAAVWPLSAQDIAFDSSGNGLLKGVYNFRQVVWLVGDDGSGDLRQSVSLNGTINFDGDGKYELTASVMDSAIGSAQTFNRSGLYTMSAGGFGYLSSTVLSEGKGSVFGMLSQGVFVGSSTEDGITDLFIAAPAGEPVPANENLNGRYWVAEVNLPGTNIGQARDALFQINPDGQGSLGTIGASGYIGGSGRTVTQTITGASYQFTNGVASVTFGGTPTSTNLLAGERVLFMSPDGNFIFGGSPTGWNMFVGVRALSEPAPPDLLSGLYYQAGADVDEGSLIDGFATLRTYYGSFTASAGTQINHQRLLSGFEDAPIDFTYSDIYEVDPDGIYEDYLGFRNIIGAGGAIRIGFGLETTLGISVGLKAPNRTGEGVFLNPSGIANAGSFAPFTAGVARGELITLQGTNLAAEAAADGTFPTTLGGVQVMINGRPAPIKDVSPATISALVPFATEMPVARIQVVNNGVESNPITTFVNTTAPGAFTVPSGGAGYAHAVHANSSPVTASDPARPGESITLYLTGLGDVDPPAADATQGSTSPRNKAVAATAVYLDGGEVPVSYAGLAPVLVGLYQVEFTVPANQSEGDPFVDIATPDAYTSQVQIPVGSKSGLDGTAEKMSSTVERRRMHKRGRPASSGHRKEGTRNAVRRVQ